MKKIAETNKNTSEIIKQIKEDLTDMIEQSDKNEKSIGTLEPVTEMQVIEERLMDESTVSKKIDYENLVIRKKIIMPHTTKRSRSFCRWLFNNKFN